MKKVEPRDIFVVTTNTDLTEGRGFQYPIAWSFNEFTAKRLAHKKGVQGTNASVNKTKTTVFENKEFVSIGVLDIAQPNNDDLNKEAREKELTEALNKAKSLGLSDEAIEIIRNS